MEASMSDESNEVLEHRIREGMTVMAMDGAPLGRVCEVGDHSLALEHGIHEWKVSFIEVDRVDERGVWLRHGRGSLETVKVFYGGPIEAYRESAEASPSVRWKGGFDRPAVSHATHHAEPEARPEEEGAPAPTTKPAGSD
jgi:hypothetical protein